MPVIQQQEYSGVPVSWISQKQHSVSLSMTDAEYITASEAAKECIWLKNLFIEIAHLHQIPILQVDNESAVKLIKKFKLDKRLKHIAITLLSLCKRKISDRRHIRCSKRSN